jgi:tyrosyl-tRNA synthetase
MVKLCAKYRLARMLEHEDFRSRLANNQPISIHELLYPLLVAYDSVVLEADVELGATEQKFNLLMGREIQREYGKELQVAMTMPILVGLDGKQKMSKSLGNYVGITEPPGVMFGKLMSISDQLMWPYYELLTDFAQPVIERLREEVRSGVLHPMAAKTQLAHIIVAGFHGEAAAKKAAGEFQRVFRERQAPTKMREMRLKRVPGGLMSQRRTGTNVVESIVIPIPMGLVKWSKLLAELGEISSASKAEQLILGKGFDIDGRTVTDPSSKLDIDRAGSYEIRLGKKKFLRVIVE